MIDFFKKNYILFLYLIIPLGYLLGFFSEKVGIPNYALNFIRITILLLLYKNDEKNKIGLTIFLAIYFCLNIFLFEGKFNIKAQEVTTYILYIATLFSSKYIFKSIQQVQAKKMLAFFGWFALIYVVAFIITAAMTGLVVNQNKYDTRTYYNGFVISHQLSYMAILFAFIFFKFKKWIPGVLLLILAVSVGNRTAFLIIAVATGIYFEGVGNASVKKAIRIISLSLAALVVGAILYTIFVNEYLTYHKLEYLLTDPGHIHTTSGRSLFWYKGISEMNKDGLLSISSFVGRGPASVQLLLFDLFKIPLWMHNDFMQIIYCYGIFGMAVTIYGIYYFSKVNKTYSAFWFILVAGLINGFYTYGSLQLLVMIVIILNFDPKARRGILVYTPITPKTDAPIETTN